MKSAVRSSSDSIALALFSAKGADLLNVRADKLLLVNYDKKEKQVLQTETQSQTPEQALNRNKP